MSFIFCFPAAITCLLIVANWQTNWNSLGCNNFEGRYSIDYCYADYEYDSEEYVCLSDNRLAHYLYESNKYETYPQTAMISMRLTPE